MTPRPSSPPVGTLLPTYRHAYLIAEDEMGESAAQDLLLAYLVAVLRWLFHAPGWYVARNLTFFHPAIDNSQHLISPDLAVFRGLALTPEEQLALTSWDMLRDPAKACPPVVIEVSSDGTWRSDVEPTEKPHLYGLMGVQEYYAYDPAGVWKGPWRGRQLLGWRYEADEVVVQLEPDAQGRLWSVELESWLVPDGPNLRLYTPAGQQRLTEAEAKDAAWQAERAAHEAERAARESAEKRIAELLEQLRHASDTPGYPPTTLS